MRLPSWPPIPHQQVENNTLLFFSWHNVQDSPRQRAALSLVQGGTRIGFISDSASPGDCLGRPHQAWQETFYSPSSEPLRHRPTSLQAVVFVTTGVRSHFVTVVLLYADHQPPGPNCRNLCLITHSLTDELLWPLVLLPEAGSNQIQILVTTVNWIFIILIICTLLENSFFKDFLLFRPTFVHKYLYFALLTLKKACYFCA